MMKLLALVTLAVGLQVNPIQKVLTLLDDLKSKVLLDGEVEQKQYEKFTEWCEDDAVSKQYAIKNGKAKVEDLSAVIEKEGAAIQNAASTINDLAGTVTANENDLKAATEIRDTERADFDKADRELEDTIDMIGRAIMIVGKAVKGGSFAQFSKASMTQFTQTLQVIVNGAVASSDDKEKLEAFVQSADDDDFLARSAPQAAAYESHSSGILEVLEDMKDKAMAMRNDGQKSEMKAQHAYELLAQSLKDALAVDGKELNAAKSAKSLASEAKAQAEGDKSMTVKMVAETTQALQTLAQDCQGKAADWEMSQKSRAEELDALTQARKIIADKAGGASSRAYDLLEVRSRKGAGSVVDELKRLGKAHQDVALSQLALRVQAAFEMSSGADVFGKVRAMITELIDKLVSEAAEEADHKAWCDKETAETQAKIEDHQTSLDKLTAKIDKTAAAIVQLTESLAQLQSALADLAKQQAAMDAMRVEEHAAYVSAKKDYEDGVEGLTLALQLMRDYYAQEPEALVQALVHQPTTSVHAASTDAASGIIGLLEVAQSDFSKLLADTEVEETSAEKEYEKMTHQNKVDNAMKTGDVKYQTKEKAGLEKTLAELKEDHEGEQAELDAVVEYFARVRPGCTTKPMTYAERKARRESEIEGLKEALRVLEADQPAAFLALRSARRA